MLVSRCTLCMHSTHNLNPTRLRKTRSLRRRHTAGSGFKGHQLGAPELFKCMLQTLAIKDWGLFKPHD